MENQQLTQQPEDLEQNEQGQGSSGLEQQQNGNAPRDTDKDQNDIAGNASGNQNEVKMIRMPQVTVALIRAVRILSGRIKMKAARILTILKQMMTSFQPPINE